MNDLTPQQFELDRKLIDDIRNNFSARQVSEKLMSTCVEMAACVGVKITWHIETTDEDKIVESAKLIKLLSRLATLGGAFCLGGKINPIEALKKRERDVKKAQIALTNRKEANTSRFEKTKEG